MSYNAGDLSRGPCCEINKLIVQVVGKDHPATQRLAFYEKDADKRLDKLTAEDDTETVSAWMCKPSSLHLWDWDGEPGHRMVLEVEEEHGATIKLPLPDVHITIRQLDKQWNQIVPVLPFVALPGISSAQDHGTPVLCRPGYLYVFMEGRLWRELEIRIKDERTTYHDIELDKFRTEDGFVDDARLATGKALDDIWLPANWNDRRVDIQLCFSEVQLSHARLKRLEQDPALRRQRCQSPDLRVSREDSERRFTGKPDGAAMLETFRSFDAFDEINQAQTAVTHAAWLNLKQNAFPLTVPAPQRARQVGFEWMLDQPAQYLCDLSGEFLTNAFNDARQHVQVCEKGTAPYRPRLLETGAWAQRLEQILATDAEDSMGLWEAHPPVADVLSNARDRELHGVMLEDPHYRLHHLHTRIQDQQHLLELCGARAQQYGHHGSALLIQQLVIPPEIGGQKNPLHQKLDLIKEQGRLDINRFTATGERAQLWRSLEMSQALLCEYLQLPHVEQSIADYLSQDGFKYAASLHFVSQLFVALALRPAAYDPLAASGDITDALTLVSLYSPKASAGQQWLTKVANDLQHPLHLMLWPDAEQQNLDAPYQAPSTPDINVGDGQFRATELARFEQKGFTPGQSSYDINSLFLTGLLENESWQPPFVTGLKGLAGALVSLHENLQGAVEAADKAVNGAQHKGQSQQSSDTPVTRSNAALHRRGIAQLRSMLPQTFGDLHYLGRADAHRKGYYVFGLDDIPQQSNRSHPFYGVYRNQHGILQSNAAPPGFALPEPKLPPDRRVLGMPGQHPTARAVREANGRFNQAWQSEQAERAADQSGKTAIQNAVEKGEAIRSGKLFRMLDSVPFAAIVVGLEFWNLRNELGAQEQASREKNKFRAGTGVASAWLDLTIAIEALTVKLAGTRSALAAGRKTLLTISETSAKRLLGSLANRLVKNFSGRLLGQIFGGLLFAGINLYDAWYSYRWGDNAYVGQLVLAAGGLVTAASSLIVATSTFLGLSPLGWLALFLIVVGAALTYFLSSSAIEDWLKKGPFGSDPRNMAEHLEDPQTAFYYLVSILANIQIAIERNPDFKADATMDFRDPVPFAVRSANTRIRIQSNLGGLMSGLGEPGIAAFCALEEVEVFYDEHGGKIRETSFHTVKQPVAHRLWPDALEVLVKTPFSSPAEPLKHLPAVYFQWRVRVQFLVNDGQQTWVFPAPPPKDPTPFGPAYAKPDFASTDRLFWADEIEHAAEAAQ